MTDTPPPSLRGQFPEAHVLVPYTVENGTKVSPSYDFADYRRQLDAWFGELGLPWTWHAISPADVGPALDALAARIGADGGVVVNLCDGSDEDGYPGLSVVQALERHGLPFTGAGSAFYHLSTCKLRMKAQFRTYGVPTAPWAVVNDPERDLRAAAETIGFPLFMKPAISAGSHGLSERSVVWDVEAGVAQFRRVAEMRAERTVFGDIFVESFVRGREFTGLVLGDRASGARV
jgi:D-alanine-D-alanine ligase